MNFKPISPYFIIKVPIQEEKERREKDGFLALHPNFVWLTRNTQCGIVEGISEGAAKNFPDVKMGDMLLVHHFVQRSYSTKGDNDKYLVWEDENYRYYNVTSCEIPGHNNMTYGIYRDGKIIPHPQYLFLEKEPIDKSGWYQDTEKVYAKLEEIKQGIERLSKMGITEPIANEIRKREKEMANLNKSLQSRYYRPYKILFSNSSNLATDTNVYAWSVATQTCIEVQGIEYRLCETRFVGAI